MHVSITDVWCDPDNGTCEVGRRVRGVDLTEDFKHHSGKLKVARCDLEGRVVFVVSDLGRPRLEASVRATVIESLLRHETSLVAVVTETGTGWCTLTVVPPGTRSERAFAAQAAAVVQASWGWDEAEKIHVNVDDEAINVAPHHGADGWFAQVRIRAGFRNTIDPPWTGMTPVRAGDASPSLGTPSVYVTVERDGEPVLRVDLYEGEPAHYAFQEVAAWSDLIVMGFGSRVHRRPPGVLRRQH